MTEADGRDAGGATGGGAGIRYLDAAAVAACLPAGRVAADDLIKQLDSDFEVEVSRDARPQPLRDAARLLAETNQSDRWTNYAEATRVLRRARNRDHQPHTRPVGRLALQHRLQPQMLAHPTEHRLLA